MPWYGREKKPRIISIDLETYSDIDLKKCGAYRYVEGDFHILLFAYAFDDEDVQIVDLASGEELPECILVAIEDPAIIKSAWNAAFERTCIGHMLGRTLSPDDWRCSMVWAASLSLPLGLKNAAVVLKTGEQKDRAGENLIKFFSEPCKPTATNGGRTRNLPLHDLEKWEKFKEYCLQDVRTERDIRYKLEKFPMPDFEWDNYHVDQRINDRGVKIDTELVEQAIKCDQQNSASMEAEAKRITGLVNPNSVSQLKEWLDGRGVVATTLDKKGVGKLIEELENSNADAKDVVELLKLRLMMAKSSVKKYEAAQRFTCSDGRAHGLFQFNGANRTGRYSGRGIQLQNLPQNHIDTLDEARGLLKTGEFEMLELLYGNTPDILSQLIRTMLIPREGCEFIVADFSAIEARLLAWEAGEEWRIEAFKAGQDIYCASASQMFGVPVVKHGINGHLRQKGKVAELACIAEGELVLTDQGLVPIEYVSQDMKLWDGKEWVQHEGVIEKGERYVITYDGLTATPDHLVWIEGKAWPVRFGFAAASGAHLVQTGDGGRAIRLGKDYQPGKTMRKELEQTICADRMSGMRGNPVAEFGKPDEWEIQGLPKLFTAETNSTLVGSKADCSEAEMRESQRSGISQLWSEGHSVRFSDSDGCRPVFNKEIRNAGQSYGNRSNQQRRKLCSWESEIRNPYTKQPEQKADSTVRIQSEVLAICAYSCDSQIVAGTDKGGDNQGCRNSGIRKEEKLARNFKPVKVYDIRNAGPRHRFTVSGRLVHNCGYGGSVGALKNMGALEMGLNEDELPDLISTWREANPAIVQYWWDVDRAVTETFKDGQDRQVGKIGFQYSAGTLWMVLPSGRRLAYIAPQMRPNRFGRQSLTYMGVDSANKWSRIETYGPKCVENLTQAIARDILCETMQRMEKTGLDIVGHVHDEVIIEAPEGKYSVDDVCSIMNQRPTWGKDIELSSAGYKGGYYFKD